MREVTLLCLYWSTYKFVKRLGGMNSRVNKDVRLWMNKQISESKLCVSILSSLFEAEIIQGVQ